MHSAMSLPPREKMQGRGVWHLRCAGDGCSERLAIVTCFCDSCFIESSARPSHSRDQAAPYMVHLEPGYAQQPDGTWTRENQRHYLPRGRDVRKALRRPKAASTIAANPRIEGDQTFRPFQRTPESLKKQARFIFSTISPQDAETLVNRYTRNRYLGHDWETDRVNLPEGVHRVVCRLCDGHARIEALQNAYPV